MDGENGEGEVKSTENLVEGETNEQNPDEPPKRKTSWGTLRREVAEQLGDLDLTETESSSEGPEKLILLMEEGENSGEDGSYLEQTHSHHHHSTHFTVLGRLISKESLKAVFIFILVFIAAVNIGLVEEENASERTHRFAIYQDEPIYFPIEMESELFETTLKVPPLTDLRLYEEEPACIISAKEETNKGCNPLNLLAGVTVECAIQGLAHSWRELSSWNITLDITSEKRLTHLFDLINYNISEFHDFRIVLTTNHTGSVAVTFEPIPLPHVARFRVLFAGIVLVLLYVLIIFEFLHQTVAALLCAFIAISCLALVHARPDIDMILGWIDYQTIGLLFGMMIMVGIFSRTGFFEWAAVKAYKISQGNLWYLTILLSSFTCLMSAFLDNVTTMLLVAPVTLKLCRVLDLDPQIILLSEVIFSNIGGTATIIGDPPNIIIANHPRVAPFVNFLNFTGHVTLGVFLCLGVTWLYLWKLYSKGLHRDPSLRVKASVQAWKKTLAGLDESNPEESDVRTHVLSYITNLEEKIEQLNQGSTKIATIAEMEATYQIKDWPLFIGSSFVLFCVILLFFIHPLVGLELNLALIALIGAVLHMLVVIIITGKSNPAEFLEKVEWGTLGFFSALFILMEAISKLGLIDWIANILSAMIAAMPEGRVRLFVAVNLILWISGLASAFIDNIPYTATLVPVVVQLAEGDLGLPLTPLVWALVFGTCLGGNGTIIGASANVVAVGLAEQNGFKISFGQFFRFGFPIMLITIFVASIWLTIFHVLVPWY